MVLDTAEPEEKKPSKPRTPEPIPEKSVAQVAPLPPPALREPPPPADPKCLLKLDREHVRGAQAFLDVKRAGREVLVVGSDGTVRQAEHGGLPVVHDAGGPLLGLAVSPDGGEVAAVGYGVLARSSDGGRTFRTERAPSDAMFYAAAFAGDALLVFDGDGRGWRSVRGGLFEQLSLPRTVAYAGAAFADARRGYLVGWCGTLLETLDGGVNWKALRSPLKEGENIEGVLVSGDTLYVSGDGGVWRSEDRGRTFQQVLSKLSCVRLARSGNAVAAACGGGLGNVLQYAANGRDFQPVPVPYSHALLAVELLPEEELLAVGVREQFIRARPSGGAITSGSKVIQEWKAFLDKHQREGAAGSRGSAAHGGGSPPSPGVRGLQASWRDALYLRHHAATQRGTPMSTALEQSPNSALATGRFGQRRYLIRKKFFKLFGDAFHIYDDAGNVVFYSKMKAFKLKEDLRVFSSEEMNEEVLSIKARGILDIGATYDVTDSATGQKVGALRRKGLKSILRDEWLILDVNDREVGTIQEDSMVLALVRRLLTNLVPQTFQGKVGETPVFTFRQRFNPIIQKVELDFSLDRGGALDRRLGIAAAVLLCAIEGRQQG